MAGADQRDGARGPSWILLAGAGCIGLCGAAMLAWGLFSSGAPGATVGIVGGVVIVVLAVAAVTTKLWTREHEGHVGGDETLANGLSFSPIGIVEDAWRICVRKRRELGRLSIVPVALGAALHLLWPARSPDPEPGTALLFALVWELPLILFAIPWHRVILLDESVGWKSVISWSTPHFIFVSWALAVQTVFVLFVPTEVVSTLCILPFVMVAAAYVFARTSLLLPAAAIGEPPSLAVAWSRSSGHGWALLGTYFVAVISSMFVFAPIWAPGLALFWPQVGAGGELGRLPALAFMLTGYASQAVIVASLSLVFADLVPRPRSEDARL